MLWLPNCWSGQPQSMFCPVAQRFPIGCSPNWPQHNSKSFCYSLTYLFFFGCYLFHSSLFYFPTIASGITSKMNFLLSKPCLWVWLCFLELEKVTGGTTGGTPTKLMVRKAWNDIIQVRSSEASPHGEKLYLLNEGEILNSQGLYDYCPQWAARNSKGLP